MRGCRYPLRRFRRRQPRRILEGSTGNYITVRAAKHRTDARGAVLAERLRHARKEKRSWRRYQRLAAQRVSSYRQAKNISYQRAVLGVANYLLYRPGRLGCGIRRHFSVARAKLDLVAPGRGTSKSVGRLGAGVMAAPPASRRATWRRGTLCAGVLVRDLFGRWAWAPQPLHPLRPQYPRHSYQASLPPCIAGGVAADAAGDGAKGWRGSVSSAGVVTLWG